MLAATVNSCMVAELPGSSQWAGPEANMAQAAALQAALAAATAAAQAATTALTEIKQTKASGLVSKPKELELSGKPEEDRRTWQDWKFAAVQYTCLSEIKSSWRTSTKWLPEQIL